MVKYNHIIKIKSRFCFEIDKWIGVKKMSDEISNLDAIYTNRQKLSNTTFFFGDTVLEVAERNMWVMEIKYLNFYCKLYYYDEHFELKWYFTS